jgi:hypothetical protein
MNQGSVGTNVVSFAFGDDMNTLEGVPLRPDGKGGNITLTGSIIYS